MTTDPGGSPHKFDIRNIGRLTEPSRLGLLDVAGVIRRIGPEGLSVLVDVGTGAGIFAGAFLDRLPGAVCWCLDIRPELVDWIALHRAPAYGDRMRPLLCGESSLPLPGARADMVFMITLHHELEEPAAMLGECLRVLRPGGSVFVADWKPGSRPGCPHQDRFLAAASIVSDLEGAGFTEVEDWAAAGDLHCISARRRPG